MRNIKTIFALLLIGQMGLSSCKKQETNHNEASVEAKKFAEIKANENFNWSTNKVIQLNFKSTPSDARVAVLKVVDDKGVVYFKKLQKANESFTGTIHVPSHIKTLKYVYGGIQKEFSTNAAALNIIL